MRIRKNRLLVSILVVFALLLNTFNLNIYVLAQESLEITPAPETETTPTPSSQETTPTPTNSSTSMPVENETLTLEVIPSPTATPEENVDIAIVNESEIDDDLTSQVNSGENEILVVEPSPTTTPTPVLTSITDENTTVASTPENQNLNNSEQNNPQSLIQLETPQPTSTPIVEENKSKTETGDSASVTSLENNINTNIVNSLFIHQTLNIFVPSNLNNIDLSKLAENATNKVFKENDLNGNEVNLSALSVDNFAYVENNIEQISNTGNNNIDTEGGSGEINTGNAYSVVTVLNNVNTNLINSKFYLVTINIFNGYEGDIILPTLETNENSNDCCGEKINIENTALVTNNISSLSDSGNNQLVVEDEGQIETGNAQSVINVFNIVNVNYINVVFKRFTIKTFGEWFGDFLGWEDLGKNTDSNIEISSLEGQDDINESQSDCTNCSNNLEIKNNAVVKNNIISSSNTGNNSVVSKNGKITTGNSYSSVSVFNFINSNIYNSTGFVGFINIFGKLKGDIGDEESIQERDEENSEENQNTVSINDQNSETIPEEGGAIELTGGHNVGEYVFPGDTITFQAKIKNSGTGKLYDTLATIEILRNGVVVGGANFLLNEINPNKSKTLTTGLKLSNLAIPGEYQTRIRVEAVAGSKPLSSEVIDIFLIKSKYSNAVQSNVDSNLTTSVLAQSEPSVLGTSSPSGLLNFETKLIIMFGLLLLLLLILKSYKNRRLFILVYKKALVYANKVGTLLTSIFA